MALSDAMERLDLQDDAQNKSLGSAKSPDTFHRYLDLPFELREPIRSFAIQASLLTGWNDQTDSLTCSRLACVSKEWQLHVEKKTFSQIRIDPLNEDDVSKFERYFTDRRKKYLTQFEIAMDDDSDEGLWMTEGCLLYISQIMAKAGKMFQLLNGWDFTTEGEKQRPLVVMFASVRERAGYHQTTDGSPDDLGTRSLWDPNWLGAMSGDVIPTNVVLWAIKSEFPSSLGMVTHLTLVPDFVPVAAAKRIIQIMPNLQSCDFEFCFPCEVEAGWRDLTDFIQQLRVSAPSLHRLRLFDRNRSSNPEHVVPAGMVGFANALRELSQNLQYLWTGPLQLHEAFFLPFSDYADADVAASGSHCAWPKLEHLWLSHLCAVPSSGQGQTTLSPMDILIAASKATIAMPNLKHISIVTSIIGRPYYRHFHVNRDGPLAPTPRAFLTGFSEGEEQTMLAAYSHLIGAGAKLYGEIKGGNIPVRCFKVPTEGTVGTCHPGGCP